MRYQVGDHTFLLNEKKQSQISDIIVGLLFFLIALFLIYEIMYFGFPQSLYNKIHNMYYLFIILFSTLGAIGMLISGFIILIIFSFTSSQKMEKRLVKYVEITPDGLVFEYFDGHKKMHSFKELVGDVRVSVGFAYIFEGNEKIYNSMQEFFEDVYDFINETINKYKGKKKVYPVINPTKKGKNIFVLIVSPHIFDLKKFLDDWRKNYERYLKSMDVSEECKKKHKGAEKKKEIKMNTKGKNAKTHFYVLFTIIILSVISFIFLALIPYLNTSPTSPDYATNVIFLVSDGFLTSALIIIGIIKIPRLWKTMKEKLK